MPISAWPLKKVGWHSAVSGSVNPQSLSVMPRNSGRATATTQVDLGRSPSCTSGSGERMRPRVPWEILRCAARETHPSRSIAKMWWSTAPVEEQVKDRKSECIITANFTTQILGSRLWRCTKSELDLKSAQQFLKCLPQIETPLMFLVSWSHWWSWFGVSASSRSVLCRSSGSKVHASHASWGSTDSVCYIGRVSMCQSSLVMGRWHGLCHTSGWQIHALDLLAYINFILSLQLSCNWIFPCDRKQRLIKVVRAVINPAVRNLAQTLYRWNEPRNNPLTFHCTGCLIGILMILWSRK